MILEHTLCFVFNEDLARTVLVLKTHPDWQKNLLNAPGGHIEGDELPHNAAAREVKEETGLKVTPYHFLTYHGKRFKPYTMYVFWSIAYNATGNVDTARSQGEEAVEVWLIDRILMEPGRLVRGVSGFLQLARQAAISEDSI
jgi:8-oxo-dGTP pyrophosphatase MutT (NUDIX family)